MRKVKSITMIVLISFVVAISAILFVYFDVGYLDKRVRSTRVALQINRASINKYRELNGRWPGSFSEISSYTEQHSDGNSQMSILGETISSKYGNNTEHSVLDGIGGWFYDNTKGDIKVNINKPLKEYFHFYFGYRKDDIPSGW
jgi:hypothetical protein